MARLRDLGAVDLYTEGTMPVDVLRQRVADKHALVCLMSDEIDKRVIDAGTRLKIVSNVAVGYNNIDHSYARARGVVVTNTPDVLTESVADFTWAMILAITRRLAEGDGSFAAAAESVGIRLHARDRAEREAARARGVRSNRARRCRPGPGLRHARRLHRRRDGGRAV